MQKTIFLSFLLLIACNSTAILNDFDSTAWKQDKDGCLGQRAKLIIELMERKDELTGSGQEAISEVLGAPNRHELYSRNKKAFVYLIAGGKSCNQDDAEAKKLVIRFDGIGRAKEIIYYNNND